MNEPPKSAEKPVIGQNLKVGMRAELRKQITQADIEGFARVTGDDNPLHLDEEYAASTRFGRPIAHGMLGASLISVLLGTRLPGPGSVYLRQNLSFLAPVHPGDEVLAVVEIRSLNPESNRVILATSCFVGEKMVIDGEAEIWIPEKNLAGN